jgi:hypothetical protein
LISSKRLSTTYHPKAVAFFALDINCDGMKGR